MLGTLLESLLANCLFPFADSTCRARNTANCHRGCRISWRRSPQESSLAFVNFITEHDRVANDTADVFQPALRVVISLRATMADCVETGEEGRGR